jgi:UDP-4-amino-4,6-dideoxy-N-acetyl-beta-L-altrosamine N-acetyltransferase
MSDDDLALVLEWRNAPEVRKNMYTKHVISAEEHRIWWDSTKANSSRRYFVCESDDGPVGVVGFYAISPEHGTAEWAFYAGATAPRGTGSAMEFVALKTAFSELGIEKLSCEVLSYNASVIRLHRKFGFRIEGVRRKHHQFEGQHHDIVMLSMTRKEWDKSLREHAANHLVGGRRSTDGWVGRSHVSEFAFTDSMVQAFCEISGDANPIHLDDFAARAAGFPGRIVHGALMVARISKDFGMDFPGPGTVIVEERFKFFAPLLVGEHAKCSYNVVSAIGERLIVEYEVLDSMGRKLMQGEAELMCRPVRT